MRARDRLQNYLSEQGVRWELTAHVEAYTAQEVAAAEHVPGGQVAKVVIADVDGQRAMLVLAAPARVDLMRLRAVLHAKTVRLAREEEFVRVFPDCEVGAMPPFGNLYQIPVYLDRGLSEQPRLIFNAGTHRETMTVAAADFLRLVEPTVIDLAAPH